MAFGGKGGAGGGLADIGVGLILRDFAGSVVAEGNEVDAIAA